MSRLLIASVFALIGVTVGASLLAGTASDPQDTEITKSSGGSMRTDLGHGIVLNKESSLQREWIAVKHGTLPVSLKGTPGVVTKYESGLGYSGDFVYAADFEIEVAEPITALEIRFLTFDVWGEHGKSLNLTEVRDFAAGIHRLDGTWRLLSENEASGFYASIAYVSRVRTKSGKVLAAESKPVVDEAKKFSGKFSETDLEPEKPTNPPK